MNFLSLKYDTSFCFHFSKWSVSKNPTKKKHLLFTTAPAQPSLFLPPTSEIQVTSYHLLSSSSSSAISGCLIYIFFDIQPLAMLLSCILWQCLTTFLNRCLWDLERRDWLHWCDPGLWGWSADRGSQGDLGSIKSHQSSTIHRRRNISAPPLPRLFQVVSFTFFLISSP